MFQVPPPSNGIFEDSKHTKSDLGCVWNNLLNNTALLMSYDVLSLERHKPMRHLNSVLI